MKTWLSKVVSGLALAICALAAPSLRAQSCTFFVSPTGLDTNPGTFASPWQTVQKAFTTAAAGQTVCLRGGVYPQTVVATTSSSYNQTESNSGSAGSPITFTNYPGEIADIQGSTRVSGSFITFRGTAQGTGSCSAANQCGLIFEGSQIINGQGSAYVIDNVDVCCATGTNPHNVTFDHVEITHGNFHAGLYVEGCDNAIIGSYVHDNGSVDRTTDNGIYWSKQSPVCTAGHGGLIANNIVENSYSKGIQLFDGSSATEPAFVTVTENTSVNNGAQGIVVWGDNNVVANNISYNNNNLSGGAAGGAQDSLHSGTAQTVDHNVTYNPASPPGVTWFNPAGCCITNTLAANPLFKNAGAKDWHLTSGSTANGFSNTAFLQPFDKDSVIRASTYAAGAYQLPPSPSSNTWTYVQESVITYCANNTSSCGSFAGTMIPTLGNSVWIFGISTTNDVTATVSGGGATWTECATCTTFLSGFRRNRVFYALGGTAGSTNFTITLSGSSGSSFAVTFIEVLPPAGSVASFDSGGATSSSTCTGTCTGVGFTGLAGGDVVVQFMNRIAPADYKSWPSPYLSLPNGDGLHLNAAAGTETAPVVNVNGTGAVFSAIAFKSSIGDFVPAALGPISLVQFVDPDPASGVTGLNCAPSCTLTVAATGTSHLLYLEAADIATTFISSVSGGGTWVVPASCRINGGQATANALSCAYVLASTPGATSINITMTGSANTQFAFFELATSVGQFAFETSGTATNAATLNPSGVTLSLNPNTTYALFQSIFVFGGTSSLSYYPYLRACRSGCGPGFWNGEAASDAFLNATNTTPVPRYSNQQNNSTVVSGVAFKTITTINAADCTQGSIQTALNTVAADGMTVSVPACALTNWTGTGPAITYNQTFSTTLQGQGSVSTNTTDGLSNPNTYNDQTLICDLVSNASNETLRITTAAGKSFRMTGFTFATGCGQTTARNTGVINVRGSGHSTRIDHNHFTGVQGPRMLNIASGDVWGVIDHNLFDEATGFTENFVEMNGANYAASGDSFGDASWTDVENFGSTNFLFLENNTFVCTITTGCRSYDLQQGGRVVFRYNTNKNSSLQEHNVGHDGPGFRDRGPRASEIYNNNFSWPNGGAPFAFGMDYEGGTSLWFRNSVASGTFNSFINMDYRRATGFTYSQLAPPNGWGYCGSLQTGGNGPGPSLWDENTDTTGMKCLDAAGMGKGDLLTGNSWPNVNNNVTGTQTWLRQTRSPMYVWLNTIPGISSPVTSAQNDASAVNNRDYYFDAAGFNGTTGIGTGSLTPSTVGAYTGAPTCTNGVAYWQTNGQKLWQCQYTWGTMDVWLPMAHGTLGTVLTGAGLNTDAKGPAVSWTFNPATPTGYTFNVAQGDVGGSVTVAGVTYPFGTATQSVGLNDANSFTYMDGTVSTGQRIVVLNGYVTPGAALASPAFNGQPWDQVIARSADSAGAVVMQLWNGGNVNNCLCYYIETNGAGGFIGRSTAFIQVVTGHRYAYSLLFDETNGVAKLALFDPSNNFAQVGSTITQAQETGQNFLGVRIGNAEAGTSTGTTFFEDVLLDWTNHTFPNKPASAWAVYYSPFTYPHTLVGSTSTLAPPTNLQVIPNVRPLF